MSLLKNRRVSRKLDRSPAGSDEYRHRPKMGERSVGPGNSLWRAKKRGAQNNGGQGRHRVEQRHARNNFHSTSARIKTKLCRGVPANDEIRTKAAIGLSTGGLRQEQGGSALA